MEKCPPTERAPTGWHRTRKITQMDLEGTKNFQQDTEKKLRCRKQELRGNALFWEDSRPKMSFPGARMGRQEEAERASQLGEWPGALNSQNLPLVTHFPQGSHTS